MNTRELSLVSALVACLASLNCRHPEDPGFWREPVGWVHTPDDYWTVDQSGFTLRTRSLAGLVGQAWLQPAFEVSGNTDTVTLRRAVLRTVAGVYPGTVRSPTASPGGGVLLISWRFDEAHTAPKILGDRPEIALELLVGDELRTVPVAYERRGPY